jgi:hypothetical protein
MKKYSPGVEEIVWTKVDGLGNLDRETLRKA